MPEQVLRNVPLDQAHQRGAAAGDVPRPRGAATADQDPLNELARIVAESGPTPRVPSSMPADPYLARDQPGPRREYARRDTSWRDPAAPTAVRSSITPQTMPGQLEDLEAELLHELRVMGGEPGRNGRARVEPRLEEDPREAVTQMISPRAAARPAPEAPRRAQAAIPPAARDDLRAQRPQALADDEVTQPMPAAQRPIQAAQRPPAPPVASQPAPTPRVDPPMADLYHESEPYDSYYDHDPAGAFAPASYAEPYYASAEGQPAYPQPTFDEFGPEEIDGAAREAAPNLRPDRGMPQHSRAEQAAARASTKAPRSVLSMVAAVVGVVALGGIGFAGYRVFATGNPTFAGMPLIKADTKPMKEVPPAQPVTAPGPTLDMAKSEDSSKLMSRQEDPVDKVPGKPAVRVIGTSPSVAPVQKVHSVVVRPDGTIVSPDADTASTKPASSAATPAPARAPALVQETPATAPTPAPTTTATAPRIAPAPAPDPTPAPVAVKPAPQPAVVKPVVTAPAAPVAVKPVATTPAAPVAVKPVATTPIAPAPTAAKPSTKPALAPQPTGDNAPISLAPSARTTEAAPTTAKPLVSDAGNAEFMVQVSSQRSDSEARKALQDATRKYSALGVHGGDVQQADLGARGTYYRARLAAGTREQAVALCAQIKSQGADCMVSKR
jgi:SPOR domain